MSAEIGKCSKIRHIVRLRQILRRWRSKARFSSVGRSAPLDVPSGHVAVRVGSGCSRFIVPAVYLNHPVFEQLLEQAQEEYGFESQGPLIIPCDESVFQEAVRFISRSRSVHSNRFNHFESGSTETCHAVTTGSWPLLHGRSAETPIW